MLVDHNVDIIVSISPPLPTKYGTLTGYQVDKTVKTDLNLQLCGERQTEQAREFFLPKFGDEFFDGFVP